MAVREFDPEDKSLALRTLVERVRFGGVDPYRDFTLEEAQLWGWNDPNLGSGFSVFRRVLLHDGRPVNFIDSWRKDTLIVWATGRQTVVRESRLNISKLPLVFQGGITKIAKNGTRWRQLPDHPYLVNGECSRTQVSVRVAQKCHHFRVVPVFSVPVDHCDDINRLILTLKSEVTSDEWFAQNFSPASAVAGRRNNYIQILLQSIYDRVTMAEVFGDLSLEPSS